MQMTVFGYTQPSKATYDSGMFDWQHRRNRLTNKCLYCLQPSFEVMKKVQGRLQQFVKTKE